MGWGAGWGRRVRWGRGSGEGSEVGGRMAGSQMRAGVLEVRRARWQRGREG